MEYKIFESSDTNVKKFVFEWGASAVTKKGIAEAVLYRYGEYAKRTVNYLGWRWVGSTVYYKIISYND